MSEALLSVRDLETHFYTYQGVVQALSGVSFDVRLGEAVGLVGESGCGKSVTALSILGLIEPPGRIVKGEIRFEGQDLLRLTDRKMQDIRGRSISMVFQDPSTYLNPVYTIGNQLSEIIHLHQKQSGAELRRRALEALALVRMPDPARVLSQYPLQLSGGMRQRCLIAMALACHPSLIIADEPTTAVDVTIQAAILKLLGDLRHEMNMSLLLITHNLGIVAQLCDRVVVMYAGDIVETARTKDLFRAPIHPYTKALLQAVPSVYHDPSTVLPSIPGMVPDLINPPPACRFHPRCSQAMELCRTIKPDLREVAPDHYVAGHGCAMRCAES